MSPDDLATVAIFNIIINSMTLSAVIVIAYHAGRVVGKVAEIEKDVHGIMERERERFERPR